MTIIEAINRIDVLKPNTYSQVEKVLWLSNLDGIIKNNIIDTHEGGESVDFAGYNEATPLATEMLVKAPHDDIYLKWLESWIDYTNGEYAKYNNSAQAYNDAYTAFERHYNKTHMPKGNKMKFF